MKINGKKSEPKPSAVTSPTTYSDVYIRIQPFFTDYSSSSSSQTSQQVLQFLVYLTDPEHQLVHSTLTQSIPQQWLNVWDEHDWVEDLIAEALKLGVGVVGQEYIAARMGWTPQNEEDHGSETSDSAQQRA